MQKRSVTYTRKGLQRFLELKSNNSNTVVSIVRAASQQAQLVHNAGVQAVQTKEASADEL
jgi:hypothetical protein